MHLNYLVLRIFSPESPFMRMLFPKIWEKVWNKFQTSTFLREGKIGKSLFYCWTFAKFLWKLILYYRCDVARESLVICPYWSVFVTLLLWSCCYILGCLHFTFKLMAWTIWNNFCQKKKKFFNIVPFHWDYFLRIHMLGLILSNCPYCGSFI